MTATSSSDTKANGKPASSSTSSPECSAHSQPSTSPVDIPWVPTLATTSPDNYGGLNPENEASLDYIDGVTGKDFRPTPRFISSRDNSHSGDMKGKTPIYGDPDASSGPSRFMSLPAELIDTVLSFVPALDLLAVSATCRNLRQHALDDIHWQRLVQENVPGTHVKTPYPFDNFADLYKEHDRFWFLPKYKIWFGDRHLTGKLILARFDPRRGCIEGFELLAVSSSSSYEEWPANPPVVIHSFQPSVKLHLDKPILSFKVGDRDNDEIFSSRPGANRYADEVPLVLDDRLENMYSNFVLAKPLDEDDAGSHLQTEYPYGHVWPPPTVPARHHVEGIRSHRDISSVKPIDRPHRRSEVSDQTFRIRRWIHMGGSIPRPYAHGTDQMGAFTGMPPISAMSMSPGTIGFQVGETVTTYSTLDPELYTPTTTKPWRGIWVGDYSGHGCEFLLINQPDDPPATDEELGLERGDIESDEMWEKRRLDARIYRGRLEAIKLTGDPNVPRGEYTFVADDLGDEGYVGLATEEPFTGARVVRSKGHVAGTGFVEDKFIESQLLMLGPNRLAQYWVGFGHISFFERVNIDEHLGFGNN